MAMYISLLVAVIGLLMYALSANPKLVRVGEILFFNGSLVFLLQIGPKMAELIR